MSDIKELEGIAGIIASIFIMIYLDPLLTVYAVIIIPMLLATVFLMNKRIKFNYIDNKGYKDSNTYNPAKNLCTTFIEYYHYP